ncbi:MAG TPA: hypothetical protein VLB01_02410 [Thermodesulfobacteriota bacterium]|nr:hypothetical protein [Thermodesulfobacteriota bacterium]
MTQKRKFFSYCLLILFFALTGCAKIERSYPERNYYILNVSNTDLNSSPASEGVLEIRRLTISPTFTTREFFYRKGNLSYVSDFYNQFFRPPVMLITEETRKWLSESGLFKYVLDSSNSTRPDYVLEGWNNALGQTLTDLKEDLMKLNLTKSQSDNEV